MPGYKVYYSDPQKTAAAGFGKVAHLPCILDSRPRYHRLGSEYLIDRGLGAWPVITDPQFSGITPTPRSIKNYADWLANFLEWAEVRGIELRSCSYAEHIHGRYQPEMLKGSWSVYGAPLSPATINARVNQASDFLKWMAFKGDREHFYVPTEVVSRETGIATSSKGHKTQEIKVRVGKVKQNKRTLRIPTDKELGEWLTKVYSKFGPTKGLMCEAVLLTAMRREAVACWRTDTLPKDPDDWDIPNREDAPEGEQQVRIATRFGNKGPSYGVDNHGDKIGPTRSILIPLSLAYRLHDYRDYKGRPRALVKWTKAGQNLEERKRRRDEAVHLFLDDKTGERITSKSLYDAWTGVELPYRGWSPHLARDWWACSTLWHEVRVKRRNEMDVIKLTIQPQLGHVNEETTMLYLHWLTTMVGSGVPTAWGEFCDRGE